jgi:hypothetical protein
MVEFSPPAGKLHSMARRSPMDHEARGEYRCNTCRRRLLSALGGYRMRGYNITTYGQKRRCEGFVAHFTA